MAVLTHAKFKTVCELACKQLRELAPYDTGNLALNAIKIEFPSPTTCLIYVDESIAPYMPYTTRPWVAPKWKGRKNPNEGWWQAAGELIVEFIARETQGEIVGHG
jgi:hypothetical protein